MLFRLLILLLSCSTLSALYEYEPWGKDADIYYVDIYYADIYYADLCLHNTTATSETRSEFATLIHFHQKIISPTDGPRSHYYPSSSQYMLLATQKYGFFKGFALGCDRLMRENREPWVYATKKTRDKDVLKLDPVP